MQKKINQIIISLCGIYFSSCAPTVSQLKKTIEQDPSIVFVAIEKAPEKFIEVVMKAQQETQKLASEKTQTDEKKQREEEYKNPLKPEIDHDRVIFGQKFAPITIVEYSDFQCPFCSRGYQVMQQVKKEYGDKVRIVFKHLPLDMHPLAMPGAKYFEAIALQDHKKAELFHNLVFENQGQLSSKGQRLYKDLVRKAGADLKKVEAHLTDNKIVKRITSDMNEAQKFGFSGTPGFIVNGVSLKGAHPLESFKEIIDRQLAKPL